MSSEYSYDEQGQFFPFFILVITALVTIPVTIGLLFPSKDPGALAPRTKTDYKPQDANLIDAQRSAQKRKERRIKRTLFVIAGWAVMAGMFYLIMVTQRTIPKLWNPYDILGISESASEKVIKKTYKELSRKYHPDKIKPDPTKNETMEILNSRYVEISKAYQALTDEDIRNNYIQFGHPDGKQSYSFGIALPQFIISDGNGKYVVLVYTLLLGVLLPYMVGSWWYGTQRLSKEKVLMESANNMFREYEDNIDEGGIITALSVGTEFQDMFKGDRAVEDSTKLEAAILKEGQLTPFAGGLSVKDKTKLEDLDNDVRRKALSLLWAYLGRVDLGEKALNAAKFKVAPVAIALNNSFTAIALAYMNAAPLLAAMRTSQYLIQAIPPNSPPLLQLPYFTPKVVSAVQGDSKTHMSVHKFMDLPDSKRRSLTVGAGLLSKGEYTAAINVARQLPHLRVAKAFFKVTGERFIIPSSLVSLVVKGRFIPPGSENVPEIKPEELEDIDPPEDDLDAILGRKKRDETPSLPPIAFAPYYARDHSPKWTVFLTDSKQGKVAVQPFIFTGFEKPIFDADCKPTFAMQTIKAQFQAPPQAGNYTFVMHIVSDSYVGLDTKMEVTLHVDEASKAAEMAAEDEISEPEEDTIAGTMAALKEGGLSGATKLKKKMDSDSDDESGTDDDEDDTSETNTDTEDES